MRILMAGLMALSLCAGAAVRADDAKDTGKVVDRGLKGVGKGGSKIYHDMATGVHKTIAKHLVKNKDKKARQLEKAHIHHGHAAKKEKESEKEMDKAGAAAKKL